MDILNALNHWIKKKFQESITTVESGDTSIRVSIPDQVYTYDQNAQFLDIRVTEVSTTATLLEVPEGITEYCIFHQTEDGIVFWGEDSNVTTTGYPKLKEDDVIEITGKEDFEIYAITSTGTINVFVVGTVKS